MYGKLIACGADPELFFVNKTGMCVSAEGLVGGSKDKPLPMMGMPDGFTVQEDNVSAEFNIPPAKNAREFSNNIAQAVKYINRVARKNALVAKAISAGYFTPEELGTPHAQRLGCDPDYNAWTGQMNPRPRPPAMLRTAAGHVHLSWLAPEREDQLRVIQMCDLFLGLPSILVTEQNERRELYGRAGAMRFKPYGAEYRTLDNFWVTNRKQSSWVFNACQTLMANLSYNRDDYKEFLDEYAEEIQEAINNHDKDLAFRLMDAADVEEAPNAG